jgi:transcriptional regulator with XRE-family HTH domain
MSYWLAHVLREAREQRHISRLKAATLLGIDPSTLVRLEKGSSYPAEIDRYVAGYAKILDIKDGRELWEMALEKWRRDGAPPMLTEDLENETTIEQMDRRLREMQAREQAKGPRRSDPASGSATRRRRAAG